MKDNKKKEIVETGAVSKAESIDLKDIVVHEEKYYLDSDMVVQYELNMLELPFFSKNGKIQENQSIKYIFSESTDSYMQVIPEVTEDSGKKIPQEFDERIFLALMRMAKVQGKTIYTTYYQLLSMAKLSKSSRYFNRVRESIYRLEGTGYKLKNCFYSPLLKTVVPEEVKIRIIQSFKIVKLNEIENLPDEVRKKYRSYFNRSKVEGIVKVTLSDEIYSNIEDKGYLLYDADDLLSIETSGERKLYQMLMKWSHKGKIEVISKKCKFLAAKIPLSLKNENMGNTIRILKKYSKKLKESGYISDYEFIKERPIFESSMVFKMKKKSARQKLIEEENIKLMDKMKDIGDVIIENDLIKEESPEYDNENQTSIFDLDKSETSSDSGTLSPINMIPQEHRTKSNVTLTERYIKEKGAEYTASNIRYTVRNAKDFSKMYYLALEKDFAEKDRLAEKVKKEADQKAAKKKDDEAERLKARQKKLREEANMVYDNLKDSSMSEYVEKAKRSKYYQLMLKDKIEKGLMSLEEALKEGVIMLILGEIDKG